MLSDENTSPSLANLKASCLRTELKIVLERRSTSEDDDLPPSSSPEKRASWSLKRSPLAPRNARNLHSAKAKEEDGKEMAEKEIGVVERPVSPIIEKTEDPIKYTFLTSPLKLKVKLTDLNSQNGEEEQKRPTRQFRMTTRRSNESAVVEETTSSGRKLRQRKPSAPEVEVVVTPANSRSNTPRRASSRKCTPVKEPVSARVVRSKTANAKKAMKIVKQPVGKRKVKYDDTSSEESDDQEDDIDLDDSLADRDFNPNHDRKVKDWSEDEEDDGDESMEEELEELKSTKKKKNKKISVQQSAATPRTPSTHARQRKMMMMTPVMPKRSKTLADNLSPIQEAQVRLHVSAVPDSLPCREHEFAEIFGFTESKLHEGTGGCMYISGWPGTGKTATVMEAIRTLRMYQETGDVPDFEFIEINAMRLTEPNQAYVQLWKKMSGGEKLTSDHALAKLDARFATDSKKTKTTVLLIDELDMLCNRKQSVLYNLFEWPTRSTSKLVVLAIANAMDLPERVMINRVSSRLGLTRLTFSPYTFQQLQEIVVTRLKGLKVFDKDAVQLVARKVASLSGDARRALDICRRATEIASSQADDDSKSKKGDRGVLVGIKHVLKAHEEMFCSPKVIAIRSCSKYEKLLLKSIVFCFQKSGLEETTFSRLFDMFADQMSYEKVQLNTSQVYNLVFGLSGSRLIIAEHGKLGPQLRIRLNVSQDDVLFALDSGVQA